MEITDFIRLQLKIDWIFGSKSLSELLWFPVNLIIYIIFHTNLNLVTIYTPIKITNLSAIYNHKKVHRSLIFLTSKQSHAWNKEHIQIRITYCLYEVIIIFIQNQRKKPLSNTMKTNGFPVLIFSGTCFWWLWFLEIPQRLVCAPIHQ